MLVPIGAAPGTTDDPAELVGHGPLEPDLLAALLQAAPRLPKVWVDGHGTPAAAGDTVSTPRRGDRADVRATLLRLAAQPRRPSSGGSPATRSTTTTARHLVLRTRRPPVPRVRTRPTSTAGVGRRTEPGHPGAHRVPRRLGRFLRVRAQGCEWPGYRARATRCDLDHDLAWPDGPTCACNLDPLCRHHHRVEQTGWTKTRRRSGDVTRSRPTGRPYLAAAQGLTPLAAPRPPPPLQAPDPLDLLDLLGLLEREQERWQADPGDPAWEGSEPSEACDDREPPDVPDPLGARLRWTDSRWTIDLDDFTAWEYADLLPGPAR